MKKLVFLVILAVGVWLGVNYVRTGKVAFFPEVRSAAEQELDDLEQQLDSVQKQIEQAGRAAGLSGMDTTSDVSSLMEKKRRLEERIAELRKKLFR
jgi:peptidoglycan hydrolase CwlO-like protein